MIRLTPTCTAIALALLTFSAASAEEFQLSGTARHGPEAAQAAAVLATDGILRVVNGFEPADVSGDMAPITALANSVYAVDADVFRSQEFITEADAGGAAFLKSLGFIHEQLGGGAEYLAPQQVCAIYAFRPEDDTNGEIDFTMATSALVPQFGQVLNMVLVRTKVVGGLRQITYHDYLTAPAAGQDCTGPAASAFDAEWAERVQ
ncbi:MAG: hypothetical protein ACFE0R_12000 [Salinarimonas sp.]